MKYYIAIRRGGGVNYSCIDNVDEESNSIQMDLPHFIGRANASIGVALEMVFGFRMISVCCLCISGNRRPRNVNCAGW
jgi:hypothetical protein